ncbi:sensor histidine kinase [Micromonospora sp. CPCC 206061]|uniref:sensor histidine kinase n=1 Tax=Micromonospora sp. CPCC 206061 TaxID=3122410 RepID=UPI002FEF473D
MATVDGLTAAVAAHESHRGLSRSIGLHSLLFALLGAGGLVTALITGADAALAATGLALVGMTVIAIRVSRHLRRLRAVALDVAYHQLPTAVSGAAKATDAEAVGAAVDESTARVDALLTARAGEVGALARAFATVHRQALRLAADEALTRMESEATLAALSRRGQALIQRQLRLIEEFVRLETDRAARGRLLALDRLASRMRRNEENLLVLAGGDPGRRPTEPVSLREVVRTAAAELDDPDRVKVVATPLVAIAADAVADVIHVLAELLENAANFSHPANHVRVDTHQDVDQVTLTIFDEGIGMAATKLAEANRRLAEPSALTSALVGTMGLLVIGRLARRHGITVKLTSVPDGGTAAFVALPHSVLAPLPTLDRVRRGRYEQHALPAVPAPMSLPAVPEPAGRPRRPAALPAARPAALPSGPVAGARPAPVVPQVPEQRPRRLR